MLVKEAIEHIQFAVGSMDDVSGRSVNPMFTLKQIAQQLNFELNQYANKTKGIQDVFSFPLDTNIPFVRAPELALRSEGYSFIMIYINQMAYPLDMKGVRDAFNNYRFRPLQGVPNWIVPWSQGKKQFLSVFPTNSVNPVTATLKESIGKTETQIPIVSGTSLNASRLILQEGRVTIGNEKILYKKADKNYLYDCERGIEGTEPEAHDEEDLITQNNVVIFYSRLPKKITVMRDNTLTDAEGSREIEVCEEHLQGIIKSTTYNLLLKIPNSNAEAYKIDSDVLYEQYASDIRKGYYRTSSLNVRAPYPNETSQALTSLLY